jgi:hypothetical protein
MDALMVDAAGVAQQNATMLSESSVSTNSSASDWGAVDPGLRLTGMRATMFGRPLWLLASNQLVMAEYIVRDHVPAFHVTVP